MRLGHVSAFLEIELPTHLSFSASLFLHAPLFPTRACVRAVKRNFESYEMLGGYCTGTEPTDWHLDIHKQVAQGGERERVRVCVRERVCVYVCVCMHVCLRVLSSHMSTDTDTHTRIHARTPVLTMPLALLCWR